MKGQITRAFAIVVALLALAALVVWACAETGVRTDDDDDDDTTASDTDVDTDSDSDSDSDSDTGSGDECELSELETFDTEIPTGWTVVDNGTSAGNWEWVDAIPGTFPVDFPSDGAALIDSQAAGEGPIQDDDLISPLYDLGNCPAAELTYDYNFQKDLVGTDVGEVYLLPGGDGEPVLLISYSSDSPADALASADLDITDEELDGETTFKVMFHYEGSYDLGWYVDNFGLEGVP